MRWKKRTKVQTNTNNCNLYYKALCSSFICLLWLAKPLLKFFKFNRQCPALQLVCNKKKDYYTAVQWIKEIKSKLNKKKWSFTTFRPNSSLCGWAIKNNCFTSLSIKAAIRLGWMCILDRFFIQTSVMVALIHIYNLLSALI